MSCETLHQCNLDEKTDPINYFSLVNKDDAVVFYAEKINETKQTELKNLFIGVQLLFVTINQAYSYSRWVNLVDNAKRTLTWK